jgi:hypothetical protein
LDTTSLGLVAVVVSSCSAATIWIPPLLDWLQLLFLLVQLQLFGYHLSWIGCSCCFLLFSVMCSVASILIAFCSVDITVFE